MLRAENDIRIRKQWFENNDLDFYSKPTDQNFQNFNNKNLENKKDTDLKNENSSEEAEFVQENKCKASDIQENPHVDTVPNKQESEMRNNFYNSYYNDNTNNQVTHTPSSLNNYPSSNPSSQYNTHNNTYNSYNGDADTDANHKDFPTSDASYSLPNDNEYHGQGDNGNGGMKQDGSADDDDRPAWLKEVLEEEARLASPQKVSQPKVSFDENSTYMEDQKDYNKSNYASTNMPDNTYEAYKNTSSNNGYNTNEVDNNKKGDNYYEQLNKSTMNDNTVQSPSRYGSYNHKNKSSIFDPDDGSFYRNNRNFNKQDISYDNRLKAFREPQPNMSMLMHHSYTKGNKNKNVFLNSNNNNNNNSYNNPASSQLPSGLQSNHHQQQFNHTPDQPPPFFENSKKYVPTWVENSSPAPKGAYETSNNSFATHNVQATANDNSRGNSFYNNYNSNDGSYKRQSNNDSFYANSNGSNNASNNNDKVYSSNSNKSMDLPETFATASGFKSPGGTSQGSFWDKFGSNGKVDFRKKKVDINSSFLPHSMRPPMRR